MRQEREWPDDAEGRIFILRALQRLIATGVSNSEAERKILDWLTDKPDPTIFLLSPAGTWFGLKKAILLKPENRSRIFAEGVWRSKTIGGGPRTWQAIQHGAAADVFLPAALLDPPAPPRSKGGRPAEHDWAKSRDECFRPLDENGDISPDDNADGGIGGLKWNSQAKIEEALQAFGQKRFGRAPANSAIREYVTRWRREWRAKRRG